ncbi:MULTISPECIES: VasL domain-containing protein [unclassified Tatumella]|uniref:VasL domain-containing protein n=1 Tax=unclassified Tatumella TaxID=2649542 RepID=UPI001BB0A8AF|nr:MULTISPECIES: VasL domain-containing protein [unclassified Tatumella]MBS0878481.1 type VI secretion system ImpA family N-terminal domain-containing protein [Tatumella sp. JGM82]MBS0891986.1 type VI secretion system ImpA family N-terminal domain-containing protein [Tatumella sp. JGM94]MBS0903104.1 type VI secretion system ImpA family N-terminal domain-containing protein [Tatumella sp. JGM100]
MNDITSRKIKTGGDPRMLTDYISLRDELSKLTHPARPDVDWHYVEKRCLSLFEMNGVELQTAAWYTLARMQLAGIFGLNEGLVILEALISHQWDVLWPRPAHARMDILRSLSQRLQQRIRSLPFNYRDLSQLYRAEQLLISLGEKLQHPELKLDTLRALIHNSAVRLENSAGITSPGPAIQPGIVLPATVINDMAAASGGPAGYSDEDRPDGVMKWVYVMPPEQQPAMLAPVKKWKSFAAGMFTMLVISSVAVWSWQYLRQSDPLQAQLVASLAPLPLPLTPEQLDVLRQQLPSSQTLITQTQQQLVRLDKMSPDWNIDYSRQLIKQASILWPEQAKPMASRWQQQFAAATLPAAQLNGWYQGMTTLQKLSDRLNRLDQQKGKYMTVSELKSVVFSTMQSFNQAIPAEEQLRVLSQNPSGEPLPVAARSQLEMHLKQLTVRYAEIKQQVSK